MPSIDPSISSLPAGSQPEISVLVCAHNSRADHLERVMDALRSQTLDMRSWELLLVDNASDEPLPQRVSLEWHPQAQHLAEAELGLSAARRRGIRAARGEVLIFVDDDNVLAPTYLAEARSIARSWPMLGVWGGAIQPEFEQPPAEWTRPYWGMLAIRELSADRWSNLLGYDTVPCGAGMCVRRTLAWGFSEHTAGDDIRRLLGRKGDDLASCEDYDLAFAAVEQGLGCGQFVALKLTHLIPPVRLTREYLLRLRERIAYSEFLLWWLRGRPPAQPSRLRGLINWARSAKLDPIERAMRRAEWKGQMAARRFALGLGGAAS